MTKTERRDFNASTVLEVRQRVPDSIWNGALVGGAIGAGLGAWLCRQANAYVDNTPLCAVGLAGVGTVTGMLIDDKKKTERTNLFSTSPAQASRIEVAPVFSPRSIGLQLSVHLGATDR
jgi:hypothetical protein